MLIDNKYILSCDIIANSPLNESNKELRMKLWCFFSFFPDYAIKAELIWCYYHLSSEDKKEEKKKKKGTFSSTGKRLTTYIQVVAGKPGGPGGEMERAVHKV